MTEENTTGVEQTTVPTPDSSGQATTEKVEIPWETVIPIVKALMQKNEQISQLGQLLVEAESKKDTIKDRIQAANEVLQKSVEKARKDHEVPDGPEWELDLPEKEGESAFFVKKN